LAHIVEEIGPVSDCVKNKLGHRVFGIPCLNRNRMCMGTSGRSPRVAAAGARYRWVIFCDTCVSTRSPNWPRSHCRSTQAQQSQHTGSPFVTHCHNLFAQAVMFSAAAVAVAGQGPPT
jgi:hypothetical protein